MNLKSSAIEECYEEAILLVPSMTTVEDSMVVPIHMEEEKPPVMASITLIEVANTQPMVASMFVAWGNVLPIDTEYSSSPIPFAYPSHAAHISPVQSWG
jgi:hypothetical protein